MCTVLAGEGTVLDLHATRKRSSPAGLAQGAHFYQATPRLLHSPTPEECFLLSGSISEAAVQTCADGSRPRRAPPDLSMDGLMPRCQGWQGAAHLHPAQRFGKLANRPARQRRNLLTRAENAPPPSVYPRGVRVQKAIVFYLKTPAFEDS